MPCDDQIDRKVLVKSITKLWWISSSAFAMIANREITGPIISTHMYRYNYYDATRHMYMY